jgi:hypothetical protein
MKTTTVRFDPELWAKVKRLADRRGLRRAAFVRDATLAYVVAIETEQRLLFDHSGFLAQLQRRVVALEALGRGGRS